MKDGKDFSDKLLFKQLAFFKTSLATSKMSCSDCNCFSYVDMWLSLERDKHNSVFGFKYLSLLSFSCYYIIWLLCYYYIK